MAEAPEVADGVSPSLERAQTDWRLLPDGVECVWRSKHDNFAWHVLILAELLVIDAWLLGSLVLGKLPGKAPVPVLLVVSAIFAYFTYAFADAVLSGIRGRGLPARLRATLVDGVRLWRRVNERPRIDVARDAIADVRVEPDPWAWWCRRWRLAIVLKGGWRTRRVLFRAANRGHLDDTCRALMYGLRLH